MAIVTSRGDGGDWTLTEWRAPHLADQVESIWDFEGAIPHPRERHFPNGLIELVVQLDEPFHFVKVRSRERCAPTCFTGLQTVPTIIEAPSTRARVLGVRLYPAGAYAIVGSALSDATGRIVDFEDLVGRAAAELAEQCEDAESGEARVQCAAQWVSARIAGSPGIDPRIAWAAAQIETSRGLVAIARLQDHTGLSKKHLVDTFREQIGLAPKLYARVMRFRNALTLLDGGKSGQTLAQVALAAGYYDQPHMNLEFRELGGLTPGEFLTTSRHSPTTAVG